MTEKPLMDAANETVVSLAAETRFAPNGIVSRTLLRTPNSRTVLFGFAEGQELTEHTSTQHALIQIISGECEFVLAGNNLNQRMLRRGDRKSTRLNSSHPSISYAVFCVKKKK